MLALPEGASLTVLATGGEDGSVGKAQGAISRRRARHLVHHRGGECRCLV